SKPLKGIEIQNYFAKEGVDPFDALKWEVRNAKIVNEKEEVIFEQNNVEMPEAWSQLATNVVVSKYFKGVMDTPERESSLRQVVGRVVDTITGWGQNDGYFASKDDGKRFRNELATLILEQRMAFNSPVWFNVGIDEKPQCSACFINAVEDTMESILELAKTEGMLFKFGSGTGSNLSSIRSSFEGMSGGGEASGPVSFMKGYDAFAGVIKSGGKTRRAAKMIILNADHPDILDFIECKTREEKKAKALIKQGYERSFNGEAYSSIFFQNANHSIRATDEYMQSVLSDDNWDTKAITTGEVVQSFPARDLLKKAAEAAWETGDPGMQFDTTINEWHTCSNTDRINASNPCSEYMFLDESACNLASLNLMKFIDDNDVFDVEAFRRAVDITILAMEILVSNASYPTKGIEKNSHDFRPLGLGYANLGALLMSRGYAYDSDEGRAYAAAITSLMHAQAYSRSSQIAEQIGPFKEYKKNQKPFMRVIRKHADSIGKIDRHHVPPHLMDAVHDASETMVSLGSKHGFRNSQVTVLAPTGTIAFMMDCDTTGIEPDIALVKFKKLVGGGQLKIVNQTVKRALKRLGYSSVERDDISAYIDKNNTIEGAPHLRTEHLAVFDCAFKPKNGERSIHHMGHIRMMAAVQPFLSGAISKTVNMPTSSTVEEIQNTYITAWQMGLKAIAIYRDGCKASQPLNTSEDSDEEVVTGKDIVGDEERVIRRRVKLPDERKSITHKFSVAGHEGYITVGMYENGKPGEIFIVMSKEGSAVSGLMDSFATSVSIALQYGVPLEIFVKKFIHTRFEPSGYTNNPQIPFAQSVMDYLFRWLSLKFMPENEFSFQYDKSLDEGQVNESVDSANGNGNGHRNGHSNGHANGNGFANGNGSKVLTPQIADSETMTKVRKAQRKEQEAFVAENQSDAPLCSNCGAILVRNGACFKCLNCGESSGCS
ncbi:vitamin B12-dependent ribonucleotide reductase, partial [bacterium]|nr:vitamin B12-dependent ribonucleotide reductase [bacterium]